MKKSSEMPSKLIGRFIGCCPVLWGNRVTQWTKATMKLMESSLRPSYERTMYDPISHYFVVCEAEHPFTECLSHVLCLENIDVPEDIWEEIIVRRVLKEL